MYKFISFVNWSHVENVLYFQVDVNCFIYFQAFNDEEFKSALKAEVDHYKFEKSLFDIVVST